MKGCGLSVAIAIAWIAVVAACDHAPPEATPVAPPADAQAHAAVVIPDAAPPFDASVPLDAATATDAAIAGDAAAKPLKRVGARCGSASECTKGLACCATSFTGHCGGVANMPGQPEEECLILRSCEPAPCKSFELPP